MANGKKHRYQVVTKERFDFLRFVRPSPIYEAFVNFRASSESLKTFIEHGSNPDNIALAQENRQWNLDIVKDAYECYHDIPDQELTTDGRAFKRWLLSIGHYLKD